MAIAKVNHNRSLAVKVSLPYYLVALFAGLVYSVINYYLPDLPLTNEQVLWVVVTLLTIAGVDISQALKKQGLI